MKYKDYYAILGVDRGASVDEIKKRYRILARKYHPDVSKEPEAEKRFKEVAEAYATLKDADKRAAYDKLGQQRPGEDFRPPPEWSTQFADGAAAFDEMDLADLFAGLAGRGAPRRGRPPRARRRDARPGLRGHGSDHARRGAPRHRGEPRSHDRAASTATGRAPRAEADQGAHSQRAGRRAGAAIAGAGRKGHQRRRRRRRVSQHRAAPAPALPRRAGATSISTCRSRRGRRRSAPPSRCRRSPARSSSRCRRARRQGSSCDSRAAACPTPTAAQATSSPSCRSRCPRTSAIGKRNSTRNSPRHRHSIHGDTSG